VEFPKCIRQALKKADVLSELTGEMFSFQLSGGLVVGAKQMRIPPWIREHFNNLEVLEIRICKLEEGGLKILWEMRQLERLTLRFQVVPREPVVISSEGFTMLYFLRVDSRVPRVIFQEGAMPRLQWLAFQFQFYFGPPNKDPVGINHLRSLFRIEFECNENWYRGRDSPCIRPMVDIVRTEAQELPRKEIYFIVCGHRQDIRSPGLPSPPPPPLEIEAENKQRKMEQGETEEEERSSGVGEIRPH
jgi:hypothetical protein